MSREQDVQHPRWPLALALVGAVAVNACAFVALRIANDRRLDALRQENELAIEVTTAAPPRVIDDDLGFRSTQPALLPLVVENRLPTDLFDKIQPDEQKLNGLLDIEDGGTALRPDGPKSGGGGGDGVAALELGHAQSDEHAWARLRAKPDSAVRGPVGAREDGNATSISGSLKSSGAGDGFGNGGGSGALGSQGSGSGSGAGRNGSNIGGGLGKAAPPPVTRRAQLVSRSVPAYPGAARSAGHSGTVMVSIEVLPDGLVGQASIKTSSGYGELDEAAVNAAKQYRFTGALRDGKAVSNWYVVPFTFALTDN